jgi:hypothetical protein
LAVEEPGELTSRAGAVHGALEMEDVVVLPIEPALQPADNRILACHFCGCVKMAPKFELKRHKKIVKSSKYNHDVYFNTRNKRKE